MNEGWKKTSHKARRGRHVRNPVGHKGHGRRTNYSRQARLLKARLARAAAPTVAEQLRDAA